MKQTRRKKNEHAKVIKRVKVSHGIWK